MNYEEINKRSWNNRTDAHYASDFYDVAHFKKGNTSLNEIELALLGNLSGKSVLHLQCHFGQDTISLNWLGAHVTGVDLSDVAIAKAQQLATETNSNVTFVCCNVYDLPKHLNQQFDVVFTSYGTIGWLPNLDDWAKVVAHFLKPNGTFVFVEFHPFVWMYDDAFKNIHYRYFNSGPIVETESGTYADKDAAITQEYVMWNHSLSEVVSSLLKNNLSIEQFHEYDYSPYNCFSPTVKVADKKYRIAHLGDKIPMVYALVAKKKEV